MVFHLAATKMTYVAILSNMLHISCEENLCITGCIFVSTNLFLIKVSTKERRREDDVIVLSLLYAN